MCTIRERTYSFSVFSNSIRELTYSIKEFSNTVNKTSIWKNVGIRELSIWSKELTNSIKDKLN